MSVDYQIANAQVKKELNSNGHYSDGHQMSLLDEVEHFSVFYIYIL